MGGGIRRKFSMRRASQLGAGITFWFAVALMGGIFIGIDGHNVPARFSFVKVRAIHAKVADRDFLRKLPE